MHGLFFEKFNTLPHFAPGGTGGYDLFWSVKGLDFSPGYRVEWARNINGPWSEITVSANPPIADNFLLNTLPLQRQNFSDPVWFRVKVFKGASLVLTSQPMDNRNRMQKREFLMYREMLRQVNLALQKVIAANPGMLLRRKIYGAKCPECLDEILETPVSSECRVCYGTGIEGGYYAPVPMPAAWGPEGNPRNTNTTKEPSGPTQIARHRLTIFPYPEARSEDVWVDGGTRFCYLVESNQPLAFCGSVVEQRITVSRLPAHHPIYSFRIDEAGVAPDVVADSLVATADDDETA